MTEGDVRAMPFSPSQFISESELIFCSGTNFSVGVLSVMPLSLVRPIGYGKMWPTPGADSTERLDP